MLSMLVAALVSNLFRSSASRDTSLANILSMLVSLDTSMQLSDIFLQFGKLRNKYCPSSVI